MITKQQVEWLIERIAETKKVKCASCEQACDEDENCSICQNVPQEVTIGRVLEKMQENGLVGVEIRGKILVRWGKCGFSRSLQEIETEITNNTQYSPEASALLAFILNLFPEYNVRKDTNITRQ